MGEERLEKEATQIVAASLRSGLPVNEKNVLPFSLGSEGRSKPWRR
jgi:hypothetical protein